jgi:hypothetical protein
MAPAPLGRRETTRTWKTLGRGPKSEYPSDFETGDKTNRRVLGPSSLSGGLKELRRDVREPSFDLTPVDAKSKLRGLAPLIMFSSCDVSIFTAQLVTIPRTRMKKGGYSLLFFFFLFCFASHPCDANPCIAMHDCKIRFITTDLCDICPSGPILRI